MSVSSDGDWQGWLHYFLNGVTRQAEDALSRAERINQLLEKWRIQANDSGLKPAIQMVNQLGANPFITTQKTSKDLKVAFTTVQRSISKLGDLGILKQHGTAKRNKVYCARKILDILEEPANLLPKNPK